MGEDPYDIDLPDILEDSVAVEVNKEIEGLKISLSILEDNYEQLIEEHNRIEQADLMEEDGLEIIKGSYFTYLHNYAASVYTVIKHSQRVVSKFGDDDFYDQYSNELEQRNLHLKSKFLHQIRHYIQKRKVPPIQIEQDINIATEEYSHELLLRKDMMMSWDGWSSDAEEYLKTLDDTIQIKQIIIEYQNGVDEFYEWFFKYAKLYFEEDFKSAKQVVEAIEEYKEGKMFYASELVLPFDSEDFDV
jgi:hypothetical protein